VGKRKTREDLFTHELTITLQEGSLERRAIALTSKEKELANKEKWLADAGLQELATTCKTVEAQKVWDFVGLTKMALVPLGFIPIRYKEPAREVSNVLPMLEST
jgi:hypothetical protein